MNRGWIKRIATLLLLLSALDLCVPGFCRTDGAVFGSASATKISACSLANGRQDSTRQADDDDCFCCCSHIVHRPHAGLPITPAVFFVDFQDPAALPHDATVPYFRPPRF